MPIKKQPARKKIPLRMAVSTSKRSMKIVEPPASLPVIEVSETRVILTDGGYHGILNTTTNVLNRLILVSSAAVFFLALGLAGLATFANPLVPAQTELGEVAKASVYLSGQKDLIAVITNAIKFLLGILGIVFLGFIIYAGFIWIMDQGDEAEAKRARKIIKNSVLGLGVVVIAYAVTNFVLQSLISLTTNIK